MFRRQKCRAESQTRPKQLQRHGTYNGTNPGHSIRLHGMECMQQILTTKAVNSFPSLSATP